MTTTNIETIKSNATYKKLLKDTQDGVVFNLDKKKYSPINIQWIIEKWRSMDKHEQNIAGFIMKRIMAFLEKE